MYIIIGLIVAFLAARGLILSSTPVPRDMQSYILAGAFGLLVGTIWPVTLGVFVFGYLIKITTPSSRRKL